MASLAASRVAIELADRYQILLGEAQRTALEVGLGMKADGTWAARTFGDNRPRQQGKNQLIEVREVCGLTEFGEKLILHTAHEFPTANEAFLRMESTLESWDDLRKFVDRPRYANDEKGFDFRNGARIRYRSRTKAAGKGFAKCDLVVYDEAQEIHDQHLRALGPTGLANPNSQKWWAGTGGTSKSSHWWRLRRRALEGADGPFGYVEHSAQQVELTDDGMVRLVNPADITDIAGWVEAMPRLGDGFVTVETALELLEELGEDMFGLEALNLWEPEPNSEAPGEIDPRLWGTLAEQRDDRDEYPQIVDSIRVGFAVAADGARAHFYAAGVRADGCIQVEVADSYPTNMPGADATINTRAKELSDRYQRLHVRASGPAASYIPGFKAQQVVVEEVTAPDYARATGAFIRLANSADARLRHLDNRYLNLAVRDARTRPASDGKMWDLKSTDTDIGPLEAATLAVGAIPDPVASDQDMFVV